MSEPPDDHDLPDSVDVDELPSLLGRLLKRSEEGGATVVTRNGVPIAAIVSMDDWQAAEDEIDRRLAARVYPEDDGTRYSLEEVLAEYDEEDR